MSNRVSKKQIIYILMFHLKEIHKKADSIPLCGNYQLFYIKVINLLKCESPIEKTLYSDY